MAVAALKVMGFKISMAIARSLENDGKSLPRQLCLSMAAAVAVIFTGGFDSNAFGQHESTRGRPSSFIVAGYLPEYRMSRFDPEHLGPLSDLILFAAEPTASGGVQLGKLNQAPWAQLQAYRAAKNTRLLLCIGGWGRTSHYGTCVVDSTLRTKLVAACVELMKSKGLDGVDLNWEYPGTEQELEGYTHFIAELKNAFRPNGWIVSVTISPWKPLPSKAYDSADRVQLMCYDYGQRHSTYEHADRDLQTYIDKGIPAEKLVLGLPFYGRQIDDRTKTITYANAVSRYMPSYGEDEFSGYFLNNVATIRRKTRLVIGKQAGGVFVWEVGQDTTDEHSLIKAITQERLKPSWSAPIRRVPRRFPTSPQ